MFGKGIYLADMSSKSAGYTSFGQSNNEGLLLLCESELGSPMLQPDTADYNAGERVKEEGVWSTWGRGSMYPGDWIDAGTLGEHLKGIQMVSRPLFLLLSTPFLSISSLHLHRCLPFASPFNSSTTRMLTAQARPRGRDQGN